MAVGAIVLVGLLVAGGLFAAGLLPGSGKGSGTTGGGTTFSAAEQSANSAANGYQGGGWSASGALALSIPSATVLNRTQIITALNSIFTLVNFTACSLVWNAQAPTEITVAATGSDAASGNANFWLFLMTKLTGGFLLVSVSNGTANALLTLAGSLECLLATGTLATLSSTGSVIGASSAVGSANAAGGSTFLGSHPGAVTAWAISAGLADGLVGPEWYVGYSSCPLVPPGGIAETGRLFTATVDAVTGITTHANVSVQVCALSIPHAASVGPLPTVMGPLEAAVRE